MISLSDLPDIWNKPPLHVIGLNGKIRFTGPCSGLNLSSPDVEILLYCPFTLGADRESMWETDKTAAFMQSVQSVNIKLSKYILDYLTA